GGKSRGLPERCATRQGLCRGRWRSEEHTSELQSRSDLVCRLLLEKKKELKNTRRNYHRRNYPNHQETTMIRLKSLIPMTLLINLSVAGAIVLLLFFFF